MQGYSLFQIESKTGIGRSTVGKRRAVARKIAKKNILLSLPLVINKLLYGRSL